MRANGAGCLEVVRRRAVAVDALGGNRMEMIETNIETSERGVTGDID